MMNRYTKQILLLGLVLLSPVMAANTASADELRVDHVMLQDPKIVLPKWIAKFAPQLKPMRLEALEQPHAETRRMAADTFTIAAERGMLDLSDTVQPLIKHVESDPDALVRRAAARALVRQDAKSAAVALAKAAASEGLTMAMIVEPALARWDHASLRDVWLARLNQSETTEPALLRLAIECLGQVREPRAVAALKTMVENDSSPVFTRLAAARALGQIQEAELTEFARGWSERKLAPPHLGPLLATQLLVRHQDPAAIELLKSLVGHSEPAVAAAALGRLHAIDRKLSLPFAKSAIASSDAELRKLGARIFAEEGNVASIQAMGRLLDDRNPTVRRFVAVKFAEFGRMDDALKQAVLEQSMAVLAKDDWRGLEQSALVLGDLDHEPAAPRLLELLKHKRMEVGISVAWALRKLKVADTYDRLLTEGERLQVEMAASQGTSYSGQQISQIFQLFGEVRFAKAESLMRKFVPKSTLDQDARAAACFALAYLHEGKPDEGLAAQFAQRLADVTSPLPEFPMVRRMTAIGLGRMKAQSQLETLKQFARQDGPAADTGIACMWSIEQITGEPMKLLEFREYSVSGWFLEPLGP